MRFAPYLALCALGAAGCAKGAGADLEAIPPQTARVHETLRVPLEVSNGAGMAFSMRYESPESLTGLDRTASISIDEFRWTPLQNHVGSHEIDIILVGSGGGEVDRETMTVRVEPSEDSAPIFLRPGAGGTYDLTRDPCVSFDVEVRDNDSSSVDIHERSPLPETATLETLGPKAAVFDWCPTPDQTAAAERWTVELEADDGDHDATPHDYVIVLRAGMRPDCPGDPPEITVLQPAEGVPVPNGAGTPVRVEVTDDLGLRDAPLLYYSTAMPDDPDMPDVTEFEQVEFAEEGGDFVARVPSLGLEPDAMQTVYFVVSATDNDDEMGATCDHRSETDLGTFVAVGGEGGDLTPDCGGCSASTECDSGNCVPAAGGARCLASCAGGEPCTRGSCGPTTTAEGATVQACGDVAAACEGGGMMCRDDSREPDDSIATAMTVSGTVMGQICTADADFHRIDAAVGTQVSVMLSFSHSMGDLDLQLLNASGTILGASTSTSDMERLDHCASAAGSVYAKVFGFGGAENGYSLAVTSTPGACCTDDINEPDDSRTAARPISGTDFDGTICPRDDDYVSFNVASPSRVEVTIVLDPAAGDLDLELYSPAGTLVGSSRGTGSIETITRDVTETGLFVARVLGYLGATGDYAGMVTISSSGGSCTMSLDCMTGQVCSGASCVAAACTSTSSCPTGHVCPVGGPAGAMRECGQSCLFNRDCKTSESCKWFAEGRYCGRTGTAANGASCSWYGACGGQRACVPWPGGYCARAGCSSNTDCETGTFCVATTVGGASQNVCALDCWASDSICRLSEGYTCALQDDVGGLVQFVCLE